MKNQSMNMALVMTLILNAPIAALARPVEAYRSMGTWGDSAATRADEISRQKKLDSTLKALSVSVQQFEGIPLTKPETLSKRLNSSVFLKSLLESEVKRISQGLVYSQPQFIDPGLSAQERAALRESRLMNEVIDSLSRQYSMIDKDGQRSGIDSFMSRLIEQVIEPSDLEKQNPSANEDAFGVKEVSKLFSQTRGVGSQKSVIDILGPVKSIEWRDGRISKIIFDGKKSELIKSQLRPEQVRTVEIGLSTLLTYRSYQDDAYILALKALVRYFSLQFDFFAAANNILNFGNGALPLLGEPNLNNLASRLNSYLLTPEEKLERPSSSNWAADAKYRLSQQYQNDLKQAYEKRLNGFFEGRRFANDADKINFIHDRLTKLSVALPYLATRLEGALQVNSSLKQLEKNQINVLLGFFLVAQKSEILSEREIQNLSGFFGNQLTVLNSQLEGLKNKLSDPSQASQFANQKQEVLGQIQELSLDQMYLRLINRQLRELVENIFTEESLLKAHRENLRDIN